MKFIQKESGSKGNLYIVESESGKRVILDPGISWKKILRHLNYNLTNIVCALVTHEDLDHSKSVLPMLMNGIAVYATAGTLEELSVLRNRNAHEIKYMDGVHLDDFSFAAFPIEHDAAEPCGFLIKEKSTGEYLLFATDTAYIETRFEHQFAIIAIECSYDKKVLERRVEEDKINETLARRLLTTHMEVNTTLDYLKMLDLTLCREIHLIHCSKSNLCVLKAIEKIKSELFIEAVVL